MLIKTNIFNRNFYPIKIYNLSEKILSADKITESNNFYINKTTFDTHKGLLIKPFQSTEWVSSISLINPNDNFNGHIYIDSTVYTDSIDYGIFGILTGQKVDLKHNFVVIKINKNNSGQAPMFSSVSLENLDQNSIYEKKFSLTDVSDQNLFLQYLNEIGFSGYKIDSFNFLNNGIYGTKQRKKPPPICTTAFYRGDVVLSNADIISKLEYYPGSFLKIYEEDNNIQFHIRLTLDAMKYLISTITNAQKSGEAGVIPIFQFPFGISAILTLVTDKQTTPYKINFKVMDGMFILPDISDEDLEEAAPEVKTVVQYIHSQTSTDYSLLYLTPNIITLLTNPNETFTSNIQIQNLPLSPILHDYIDKKDSTFTITDITQKNNIDEYITNNNLYFVHTPLPIKKILSTNINKPENIEPIDISLFTNGITEEYSNIIKITYEYDNTTFNIENKVTINPILEHGEPQISTNSLEIYSEYTSYKYTSVPPEGSSLVGDCLHFMPFQNDVIRFDLVNIGDSNCKIIDIQFENAFDSKNKLDKKQNPTNNDIKNLEVIEKCITNFNYVFNGISHTITDVDELNKLKSYTKQDIKELFNQKINKIEYDVNNNAYSSSNINVEMDIIINNIPKNYINSIPTIIKVIYKDNSGTIKETYLQEKLFNIKYIIGTLSLYTNLTESDYFYIRPNTFNTLYTEIGIKIKYPEIHNANNFPNNNGIIINNLELIHNENEEFDINDTEIFLQTNTLPLSLSAVNNLNNRIVFDINTTSEKIYKFKIRAYTNYSNIKFIDLPLTVVSTNLDVEEALQFSKNDFFVRNNKYFLSLLKLHKKTRSIEIVNSTKVPIIINSIDTKTITDKFGVSNLDINLLHTIDLPIEITNTKSLNLQIEFLGKDFGHFCGFIILHTNLGDVYLHIAAYVNTKYKDVYVMMENRKGTNYTSPLYGVAFDYIKLTNFGDDISLLEINKLGYDQDEFLIANIDTLYPKTTNYIETIFAPTATGNKIGQIDFKIRDMLETFKLLDSNDEYIFKIQNSHILAEMVGVALTDQALPYFTKSVVDFGYFKLDNIRYGKRMDTFDIKNLGLTPFIITKITKNDLNSPFDIPLIYNNLPLKVIDQISLPLVINNNKLNENQKIYMDVFKFEIQDLKSKKIYNYEIIVKIELTENDREYLSFNSEYIKFGYCEINHFKADELQIKNFSTDKITVNILYNGDPELQTLNNFTFNLQPNQKFNVPIYFYPHGIANFDGKLQLDINNGNYTKDIDIFGVGVDFQSPLVHIENKLAEYYKKLIDYMENNKYI